MKTPQIPDHVPYFIQGAHQSNMNAKTLVRALNGHTYLVSTAPSPDGRYETRVFPEGGKGAALPCIGHYEGEEASIYGHNTFTNSIAQWDPRELELPMFVPWLGKIHRTDWKS